MDSKLRALDSTDDEAVKSMILDMGSPSRNAGVRGGRRLAFHRPRPYSEGASGIE
jgi:hypothetical protein